MAERKYLGIDPNWGVGTNGFIVWEKNSTPKSFMEVEAQPNMIYNFLNEAKGRHKAHTQVFFFVCVCYGKVGTSKSEAFDLSQMPQLSDQVKERSWLK